MPLLAERALGRPIKQVVYRVSTSDLVAASTTATIIVKKLPAGAVVLSAFYDLVTVFTSASITALACEVGVTTDTDAFVTSGELLSGPPSAGRRQVAGAWATGDGVNAVVKFTSTGANLGNGTASALTAGKVDIHILYTVAKDA
jgi:hypothetical protein